MRLALRSVDGSSLRTLGDAIQPMCRSLCEFRFARTPCVVMLIALTLHRSAVVYQDEHS